MFTFLQSVKSQPRSLLVYRNVTFSFWLGGTLVEPDYPCIDGLWLNLKPCGT